MFSKKWDILLAIVFAILLFIFTYFVIDVNLHAEPYEYKFVSIEKSLNPEFGKYLATYMLEGTDKTYNLVSNNRNVKSSIMIYHYKDNYAFTVDWLIASYLEIVVTLIMFVNIIVCILNGDESDEDD